MRRAWSWPAVLACALPMAAQADLIIEMEQPGGRSVLSVTPRRLRIESNGEHRRVMVFDGEAQKMLEIDPAARKYTELTQADAQVLAEQMQAAMAHVPPEQRARIEAMRAARAEAVKHDVKYQPTGKRDTVAGYACQGYTVIRDGEEKREGCFIPWGSAVKKEDFAALNEMGKFLDTIYSRAYGAPTHGELRITEQIDRAPGFPAVIEQVSGGKRQPEHRLVSIKRTSISADVFQAPAGYTKQEHEAMGLGRAARRGK